MAKKRRTKKSKRKGWLVSKKQVATWLNQAVAQILQQDYPGVIQTCQRILRYVPPQAKERGDALEHLATAYTMLKQFEGAYQALSQALEINPNYTHLWYNRGLTGRYTMRLVQAVHDFEEALEREADPEMREKYTEILAQTREMAEQERALRGSDFTLEQLREQQELFNQGIQMMQQEQWAEAEEAFRRVIDMGECLPQPRGNLGIALLMQKKYDKAETAFKRALEIDPDYDLAKRNLAMLPTVRQTGETPAFDLRDTFTNANIGLTVRMLDDE